MEKRKKRFGDRHDSRRIRDINGMTQIMIDLKPDRCDSDVYINQKMDVTNLVKYVEEKKKTNQNLTYFHAFVTAIAMTIYNRPKLNRFVADRHMYEHDEVVISFVAKVSFEDKSEEMMIMVPVKSDDNIDTISKDISNKVKSLRNKTNKKEGANKAIDFLGKLPNIIRVPLLGILKWCDKKGKLPQSLVKDNLYYSSIIVSNLGAIKCGAIYHNITNFGTCSSLATMGEIKTEEYYDENDKKQKRKICEFGVNLDERIADGYYFAKSLKLVQYLFDNPQLLEEKASTIIDM